MSWWERRMVGLDFETTAADPFEARIVSAAVPFVGGGEPTEEWSVLVNAGVEIPEQAQAIHGISTERVRAEGVALEEALPAILERVAVHPGDWPVVIFNAPYDWTVLDCELKRAGAPGLDAIPNLWIIDPRALDAHLERYRPGSRKLIDTCAYYRALLDGAHAADSDAIAACRLAWRLGTSGRVVRRTRDQQERDEFVALCQEWERVKGDLELLHYSQRTWFYRQAQGLEEYLHKGNPNKDVPPQPWRRVSRSWPFATPEDPIDAAAREAVRKAAQVQQLLEPPRQSEAQLTMPDWTR